MFLNKIRNILFVSAANVAGKRGNICVSNNVSSFARAFKSLNRAQKQHDKRKQNKTLRSVIFITKFTKI